MPELADWTDAEDGDARDRLVTRLRELRESADDGQALSFRNLASRVPSSSAALNKAVNGRAVPTWEVVQDFVAGCGGDPADFRELWTKARAEPVHPAAVQPVDPPADHVVTQPAVPPEGANAGAVTQAAKGGPRRLAGNAHGWPTPRRLVAIASGVALLVGVAVVLVGLGHSAGPSPTSDTPIGDANVAAPVIAAPQGGSGFFVLVSQPSQHCAYYHHIVDGSNIGSSYDCTTNASLNSYHVWIICSGSSTKLPGPSVPRGTPSTRDCPVGTHPSVGGFDRDS